jgi:hypothetical protein
MASRGRLALQQGGSLCLPVRPVLLGAPRSPYGAAPLRGFLWCSCGRSALRSPPCFRVRRPLLSICICMFPFVFSHALRPFPFVNPSWMRLRRPMPLSRTAVEFLPLLPVLVPCGGLWGCFLGCLGVGCPWVAGRARGRALAPARSARSVAPSLSLVCSPSLRLGCVLSVRSARSSLPPSPVAPPSPVLVILARWPWAL